MCGEWGGVKVWKREELECGGVVTGYGAGRQKDHETHAIMVKESMHGYGNEYDAYGTSSRNQIMHQCRTCG